MPWIVPQNKLDDQQRVFLDNVDINRQNIWIKGFAGSGKSVLLAHSIRKLQSRPPLKSMVLVVFTHSMIAMYRTALSEMGINIKIVTYYGFCDSNDNYDYIFCDEVQDLTPRVISAMQRRCKHLVVAGDSHQSIYEKDPRWREATVVPSDIGRLINGRDYELNIIHRLSRSIINAINSFMPQMNIFSGRRDMTRIDTQIRLCKAQSTTEEVKYVHETATKAVNQGETVAILIPSSVSITEFANSLLSIKNKPQWSPSTNQYGRTDFGSMNRHFESNGINLQYVGNGYGEFSENKRKINLMTFHSSKGLDFDKVFIPFANRRLFISSNETIARTLFMVAMTRARSDLYITYTGAPSDYLNSFIGQCTRIDIGATNNSQNRNFGF